jgi:hypoxanthine phosphoribosyltransferase
MSQFISIHDKTFVPYITEVEITEKVKRLARDISKEYEGKRPLFISILNGAFIFSADLFKHLEIEAEICFIKLASYKGTRSSGQIITAIGLDTDLNGRHIIILEDIIDTGKTLSQFLPQVYNQQPMSVKIAVLLHKPDANIFPINIDYTCFTIPDKFVVGYGLDYNGLGRNLAQLYQLKGE